MKSSAIFLVPLLLISLLLASGCTQHFFSGIQPQSHFDYPNSNVTPLGRVTGKSTRSAIFSLPDQDSGLEKEAVQSALAQKPGSDILINYKKYVDYTSILFIHTITLRVEGTAAKMEIGTKALQ